MWAAQLLVWVKRILVPVHHYTYSGLGEEFSPNSLIATIEVLFLDRYDRGTIPRSPPLQPVASAAAARMKVGG